MPPPLPEDEVRRRRLLWIALSELWLDTELTERDLRFIAWRAAASGYGDEEIDRIFWHEVAPVVAGNLLTTAGVWDGFDETWLCGEAARRAARAPQPSLTRFLTRRLVAPDWRRVRALLPLVREAQAAAGDSPEAWLSFAAHTTPPAG